MEVSSIRRRGPDGVLTHIGDAPAHYSHLVMQKGRCSHEADDIQHEQDVFPDLKVALPFLQVKRSTGVTCTERQKVDPKLVKLMLPSGESLDLCS